MSLHGNYDRDNIFAKILRGEIPNVTVYEDDSILAFMDVFPQSQGHVLVIPKAPSRNLLDTKPEVLAALVIRTQHLARAVQAALSPDGIIITQFNGAPAGQTVFHLHFHIIPRYEGVHDKPHASEAMANMTELSALAEKIKEKL